MSRTPQANAARGSQKWIVRLVNDHADDFNRALRETTNGALPTVRWLSPLRSDSCAEYRDDAFVRLLGLKLERRPLRTFWPARGPRWDALGLGPGSDHSPVLVEAKAHAREVESAGCEATEPESLARIRSSLEEAKRFYGAPESRDWTGTYYQYANRLAHLYFLREVNRIPAWLVFVHFLGDAAMRGPSTTAEWSAVRTAMHDALGLSPAKIRHVVDLFFDVRELRADEAGLGELD